MSRKSKQLRSQVDDAFVGGGHQVVKARERKRIIPEWVNNKKKIQEILLNSFPKLRTNPRQRVAAARWARVIQLYYRAHYTQPQVAEEMRLTIYQVEGVIRSIQRVSSGRWANGKKMRGGKRGRPKIGASLS